MLISEYNMSREMVEFESIINIFTAIRDCCFGRSFVEYRTRDNYAQCFSINNLLIIVELCKCLMAHCTLLIYYNNSYQSIVSNCTCINFCYQVSTTIVYYRYVYTTIKGIGY